MGVQMGGGAMRPWVAPSQGMGKVDAQGDFDPLDDVEKEQAEPLVEQVQVDGVAKLGTSLERIKPYRSRSVGWVGNALLERLPIGGKTPIAYTLKVMFCLGSIGNIQTSLAQKRKLIAKAEMGFGIGGKH